MTTDLVTAAEFVQTIAREQPYRYRLVDELGRDSTAMVIQCLWAAGWWQFTVLSHDALLWTTVGSGLFWVSTAISRSIKSGWAK